MNRSGAADRENARAAVAAVSGRLVMTRKAFLVASIVLTLVSIAVSLSAPGFTRPQSTQGRRSSSSPASTDTTLYTVSAATLQYGAEGGKRVINLTGGVTIEHQTTVITSISGKHYQDGFYTLLYDDVRVRDGSLTILGDLGEYFGETNMLVMTGNVRCYDEGWEIICKRATYNRENRIAKFLGNLTLRDSTTVLHADSIYYHRDTETANAFGNVVLINEDEDYSISGKHARYNRTDREVVVDVDPILNFDLRSAEMGTVKSRLMNFDIERKIGTAVRDVHLIKGQTRAECDSAVIFSETGKVELYGDPEASNGPSGMVGDRMILWYNENEVERVIIPENGRLSDAPRKGSPWREDSWIEGDSVVIYLSNEKVDSVRIVGKSKAMYYPVEGEQGKVSNNLSVGDTMFFAFTHEVLRYVRISGKSSGVYNFLNIESDETIDSLSASIDSTLKFKNFLDHAEKIQYSANVIEYFADTEDIVLHGNAVLKYQDMSLSAGRIDFNSRINVLEAVGNPILEESGQKMYGFDMGYDMDTESGVVIDGSTKYDPGYYQGKQIYKVGRDILKVYGSTYTTCDYTKPHYSFRANKMKVYIDDKIVSGPITLHLGTVPVFWLPYMVNSLRRDRHSGILRPNFDIGIERREGRFIRGLGYYWATNDYTDFIFTFDFNEEQNIRMHVDNRYKIRYMLDGNARFNIHKDLNTDAKEWTFESSHSQQIGKDASLAANLRFVSGDNAQIAMDQSEDTRRIVDRRIFSSGSFRKKWGGTSLSLSAQRNQKLSVTSPTQDRITTTLPSFSLNLPRMSFWFGEKHKEGERGFLERVLGEVMFTPNLSVSEQSKESDARKVTTRTAKSSAGLSKQFRFSIIDLSPSFSVNWNYLKVKYNRIDTAYTDVYIPNAATDYRNEVSMSLSSGVGTKLYGIFYPEIGALKGIRHTINPSVSVRYTPKLTERQTESTSLSYSVRNVIDLKALEGDDEVTKNNVLTWSLNGSFNPKLQANKQFSNVNSSVRTGIGNLLSLSLDHVYDPNQRRILSTSFGAGMNFNGDFSYPGQWQREAQEKIRVARNGSGDDVQGDDFLSMIGGGGQTWSLSLSYKYTERLETVYDFETGERTLEPRADSSIDISGNIQLTRNWRFTYRTHYNIEMQDIVEQTYSLARDLHCWQASFVYRTYGDEWSYYFQIAIKAHREIMYERGPRGIQSPYGGYF